MPKALVDLGFSLQDGVLSYKDTSCGFKLNGSNCRVTLPDGAAFDIEGVDKIRGESLKISGSGQVGFVLD